MDTESMDVVVLGKKLGTASGWDELDTCEIVFYDVKLLPEYVSILGDSNKDYFSVNFRAGTASYCDQSADPEHTQTITIRFDIVMTVL